MVDRITAKTALDSVIRKSRVHLYKPIQIAEILFRARSVGDIDFLDLESYRTKSRSWRDDVCRVLLGRECNSSVKYQDDLFSKTAIPPDLLNELGKENQRTNGAVESYIYGQFTNKHIQLFEALNYCLEAKKENFDVKSLIDSFWAEPGLRRSLDKIYEIIVYSIFTTLVEALDLKVEISVDKDSLPLLREFDDFSQKVMCLDFSNPKHVQDARVYRVGVTNAADRGIDMYSNWGPAIQIKHLSLDAKLAENIVESVSNDRVVIVCKDAERDVILSLLNQIGWHSYIQSVITENDLINWYEKALRGKYSEILGEQLIECLCQEISEEFPSIRKIPEIIACRHYENISDPFWTY